MKIFSQKITLITTLLLATVSFSSKADVVASSPSYFKIELKSTTTADIATSYAQFLRVSEWWNAEHSWTGKAEAFSIDPVAGGCFCEVDGERSILHMTVSYVAPQEEVRMLGGLGPLQMMAVNGAMSWVFKDLGEQGTEIVHRYTVLGDASQKLDALAPIVDQVQAGQLAGLIQALKSAKGS